MAEQQVALKRGPGRPPTSTMRSAAAVERAKQAEPCAECFPGGWENLGKDAYSAGCPHGNYSRG